MFDIPAGFARTIVELHGAAGREWLDRLPARIEACALEWSLTVLPPFEPLSYNYVAPVVRADGTDAVLKAGFPSPELHNEIDALRLYDGHGIARLLRYDREQGTMLLERLRPGTPLSSLRDDRLATSIAAGVMRRLWRPVPVEHGFPSVAAWAGGLNKLRARFDGTTGPLSVHLVELAEHLFAELIDSMAEPVLLHGDLHHGNIVAAAREPWLAVDPKGVTGEPAYEIGALLRNPWPGLLAEPHPEQIIARRIDQYSDELGFDRQRIVGWGIAQSVLSAWWSIEDHGHGWEWAIACAQILAALHGNS